MLRNRMTWLKALTLGVIFCMSAPARAAELDKMTPPDAQMVVVINVRQAINSPLAKKKGLTDKIKEGIDGNKEAKQILAALNLDPTKDVDSITVTVAELSENTDHEKILAIVRGSFDPVKLAAAAEKSDKVKTSKEGTVTIYEVANEKDPKKPMFVNILNKTTIVGAGSKGYLIKALKNAGAAANKDLVKAAAKVDGKQSMWLAVVVSEAMRTELAKSAQFKDIAPKLESVTFGLSVGDAVVADLNINTTDNDTPKALKVLVDMFLPVIQVLGGNDPNAGPIIKEIVDGLKITANQNVLNVNLKITEDTIDKMIKAAAGLVK